MGLDMIKTSGWQDQDIAYRKVLVLEIAGGRVTESRYH